MKKQVSIFLCVLLLCALLPTQAFAATVGGYYISSAGACVLDYETGEVLYEYNGNTPRVPASMTKIATSDSPRNPRSTAMDTNITGSTTIFTMEAVTEYFRTAFALRKLNSPPMQISASGEAIRARYSRERLMTCGYFTPIREERSPSTTPITMGFFRTARAVFATLPLYPYARPAMWPAVK